MYRKTTFGELDNLDAFTFTPDDGARWCVKVNERRCERDDGMSSYVLSFETVYQIVTVNITGDELQKIKLENGESIMNFFKKHGKVFDDGHEPLLPNPPLLIPRALTIHHTAGMPIETDEKQRLIGALITIRNHCLNCDGDHEKCMLRAKNDTSVVCPFENFGYPKDWLINLTEQDDLLEIK